MSLYFSLPPFYPVLVFPVFDIIVSSISIDIIIIIIIINHNSILVIIIVIIIVISSLSQSSQAGGRSPGRAAARPAWGFDC